MGPRGTGCGSGTYGNMNHKERVVVTSTYKSSSVFLQFDAMDRPFGVLDMCLSLLPGAASECHEIRCWCLDSMNSPRHERPASC
jgi:hypothetical protein